VSDYNGTSVAFAGGARVVYSNVGGDGFVQSMANHIFMIRSNFDRLRVRTNHSDQIYIGCHVRQIEATSISGTIVFDDGFFDPGLARFESERGNVAVGVAGPADLAMRTQDGRIFTMLGRGVPSTPQLTTTFNTQYAGGGPLVNVTSTHGSVFAYDGTIFQHPIRLMTAEWKPVVAALLRQRQLTQAGAGPARTNENATLRQRFDEKFGRRPQ
jgi:hypothetical protein